MRWPWAQPVTSHPYEIHARIWNINLTVNGFLDGYLHQVSNFHFLDKKKTAEAKELINFFIEINDPVTI